MTIPPPYAERLSDLCHDIDSRDTPAANLASLNSSLHSDDAYTASSSSGGGGGGGGDIIKRYTRPPCNRVIYVVVTAERIHSR